MTYEIEKYHADWEVCEKFLILKNPRGLNRFHYISIPLEDVLTIGIAEGVLISPEGESTAPGFECVLIFATVDSAMKPRAQEVTFGFFNTLEGAKSNLNQLLKRRKCKNEIK